MYKLSTQQQQQLSKIAKLRKLKLILLHGSQASGKTHSKSDIDIAIVPESGQALDITQLYFDLTPIFGNQLDITNLTHPDPLLLMTSTSQAKLLVGSAKDFAAIQHKAFNRYNNYQPYLDMEYQLVKQKLQQNYVTT
jgi:predicted nucleotidyltransferase